ncbi:MAG: NUDIX domain-containing protein [Ignavibacteriaceae bacterium]|nr:NUDIX domain-containing protein [Ignavibacteriaceae bacterium]
MLKLVSNMIEVHIFRLNKGSIEFLLLKRSEKEIYPGLWQMVSGSIKKGENAAQTVVREIMEETGLKPNKLWVVPNVNSFFSADKNYISFLPVFAAQVNKSDNVIISNEHCDFKWVSLKQANKMLAWVGQRKSVHIINDYFMRGKNFLNFIEVKV